MAKRKFINPTKVKMKVNDATMTLDLSRFEKQFQKAQFELDSAVMKDMQPFMPQQTGTFINVTKAMSASLAGSGTVIAAAPPMGRFLYEGKVMVDPVTGSPWARKGAKKVVTERDLDYYKGKHPNATDHWFNKAKEKHGDNWVKNVKNIAGGGR